MQMAVRETVVILLRDGGTVAAARSHDDSIRTLVRACMYTLGESGGVFPAAATSIAAASAARVQTLRRRRARTFWLLGRREWRGPIARETRIVPSARECARLCFGARIIWRL